MLHMWFITAAVLVVVVACVCRIKCLYFSLNDTLLPVITKVFEVCPTLWSIATSTISIKRELLKILYDIMLRRSLCSQCRDRCSKVCCRLSCFRLRKDVTSVACLMLCVSSWSLSEYVCLDYPGTSKRGTILEVLAHAPGPRNLATPPLSGGEVAPSKHS